LGKVNNVIEVIKLRVFLLQRILYRIADYKPGSLNGLTENAGRENDGPSKLQGMKLQDMKLADQCAGHEIAGHENDGPNRRP